MSADLFAEFGSSKSGSSQPSQTAQPHSKPAANPAADPFAFLFSPSSQTASPQAFQSPANPWPSLQHQQQQQQQQHNRTNGWGNLTSFGATSTAPQQAVHQSGDDDDDAWGDFEEAPSAISTKPAPSMLIGNLPGPAAGSKTVAGPPARNRIQRASTLDLVSNNLVQLDGPTPPEPWQNRPSWETAAAIQSPGIKSPGQTSQRGTPKPSVPKPNPKSINADVLFDADDFDGMPPEEDDDFGDFEKGGVMKAEAAVEGVGPSQTAVADLLSLDFGTPAPPPVPTSSSVFAPSSNRKQPPTQLLSTLSIDSSSLTPTPLYPQAPRSPSFSDRNPFPGLAVTTPVSSTFPKHLQDDDKEKSPTPITAWPEAQSAIDKDDWDAFADFPPDASSATPDQSGISSSWDWDAVDAPPAVPPRRVSKTSMRKASSHEVIGPPPTNVPPPSILLSVFSELLEEADIKLYKPTTNQAPAVKSRIYADPATLDYLRGYLLLATVAARILAGRKLRWHRDKFLSQGMSISAAGSKGGMKLAGIDKAQATREDREAADVVGVWRDHVGKLRSAVAAANIGIQKQPVKLEPFKVPEINDHMAVTTAKVVPTAPRACVVCGLKRDERVKSVDFEVEDSFGEWWIEHWGHRACRNFWLGNEEKLRSR